ERELLRSALGGDAGASEDLGSAPAIHPCLVAERRAQLLATVPERIADQAQERLLRERREGRNSVGPQCNDGRVDAWGRAKGARRHPPHDARLGEGLDEDRQIAALAPF